MFWLSQERERAKVLIYYKNHKKICIPNSWFSLPTPFFRSTPSCVHHRVACWKGKKMFIFGFVFFWLCFLAILSLPLRPLLTVPRPATKRVQRNLNISKSPESSHRTQVGNSWELDRVCVRCVEKSSWTHRKCESLLSLSMQKRLLKFRKFHIICASFISLKKKISLFFFCASIAEIFVRPRVAADEYVWKTLNLKPTTERREQHLTSTIKIFAKQFVILSCSAHQQWPVARTSQKAARYRRSYFLVSF